MINESNNTIDSKIIAKYGFDDIENAGKDSSLNKNNGIASGEVKPFISMVDGRLAARFTGGKSGTSYIKLPEKVFNKIDDCTGLCICTWVYLEKSYSVWERIFDFGKGIEGPYFFLTRNLRGVCFDRGELFADSGKTFPVGEWFHVAISIRGTKGGKLSNAGPIVYVNGEIAADGSISQTSSGNYRKLQEWFNTFKDENNYIKNYIGKSQYAADVDFSGALSDFRVYNTALDENEIVNIMCESIKDSDIVNLAKEKYLSLATDMINKDIYLPKSLMGEKVEVIWKSSDESILSSNGAIGNVVEPKGVTLAASLKKGEYVAKKEFNLSVIPKNLPTHVLTVKGDKEKIDISKTLYGLFYEDINNAADGGLYAELIKNRSFEAFTYDTYSTKSGENARSTGKNHTPLYGWYGDLNKVTVKNQGGLNEFLSIEDNEINSYYITAADGAKLYNRGFNDSNNHCAMFVRKGEKYIFTVWAKASEAAKIELQLLDKRGNAISDICVSEIDGGNVWKKYDKLNSVALTAAVTEYGQLALSFVGDVSIDMVSLMPENVWGFKEEKSSKTANLNYKKNHNYRLRKDLVEALVDLHPKFLRFPGGCISEGSYIWENVYDWKDSVGDVELRKENFNVWGYMMTMGLGYMEYFQLAEDLKATPLPVMACGVLCQARSDYANPAGGALRERYIKNFIDLIDFAINMDFENNKWSALRKSMGHEAAFDLHYLGVGNENWGTEFFANFEVFKAAIDEHMKVNYPGYELNIISTVGAQADDDAYQQGWKFLSGNLEESGTIRFTDGKESYEEAVSLYKKQKDYMETIADEHYYRSNDYLLNNADRYNYYYRSENYKETSKVFVGEYASTDKNTLAGAVAEAAVMTGFERNSDVVRLAATAPLFNKVVTDGQYRWTPDCIWFDDENVWRTPNYYVQQMFAKYLGDKLLETSFSSYRNGRLEQYSPKGGIEIAAGNADIIIKNVKVISNLDNSVILEQDFTKKLNPLWMVIPGSIGYEIDENRGIILKGQQKGLNGLYIIDAEWTNYRVEVAATKLSGVEGIYIGVGLTNISKDKKNVIEYAVNYNGHATGVKVYKKGVEGYTLGDYSSSTAAGNLRAACLEELNNNTEYMITVDYGNESGDKLICSYSSGEWQSKILEYKLESYNDEIFNAVTRNEKQVFIKLVNADNIDKTTKIIIEDLKFEHLGKMVTLTGEASLVHVPNVNKKGEEIIKPCQAEIYFEDSSAVINIPANSVNVLVLDVQ
ncbi:alpha-L-arabinofuranosidase [Clostridium sp. 19966]|uniref:alpha-L-arabinofuranosidase C-terminal domain-containing protein n=1 Tax=Clostridium sp. 19966 TaxID=2768166 RepID=UPI0028DEEFDC|nr:alpha-L-arabinofuranosidase C-terminal domain-containing protein [Clostridium sp. 19966]MDT8719146.1 alpha-L-arabinofuranosidase [Clostridium sp. 19966]